MTAVHEELAEPEPLDQPDGIDEQSTDLPDPVRAAARVREYIAASGDGLYDVQGGAPLYGRDLEALTRAALGGLTMEDIRARTAPDDKDGTTGGGER